MEERKLYPLKFEPVIKDKIWGGSRLKQKLNKESATDISGESWEISGVPGDVSVVMNGFLSGNDLNELLEIYMGDLVGERVYQKFGNEFPLLIKFIDANDKLSIQVHPDDKLAMQRHQSFGKTEMWYVLEAEKDAGLIVGFNQEMDQTKYLEQLEKKSLESILNIEPVKSGDVYFIPAGRVHAIGSGILLAEIQQTSDVTYRIFDFDRRDDQGKLRELHTDMALDAIDYTYHDQLKSEYSPGKDVATEVVSCPYFTTNFLDISQTIKRDFTIADSFIIYMCAEGSAEFITSDSTEKLHYGQTLLMPASLSEFEIKPAPEAKILEVYLP